MQWREMNCHRIQNISRLYQLTYFQEENLFISLIHCVGHVKCCHHSLSSSLLSLNLSQSFILLDPHLHLCQVQNILSSHQQLAGIHTLIIWGCPILSLSLCCLLCDCSLMLLSHMLRPICCHSNGSQLRALLVRL